MPCEQGSRLLLSLLFTTIGSTMIAHAIVIAVATIITTTIALAVAIIFPFEVLLRIFARL